MSEAGSYIFHVVYHQSKITAWRRIYIFACVSSGCGNCVSLKAARRRFLCLLTFTFWLDLLLLAIKRQCDVLVLWAAVVAGNGLSVRTFHYATALNYPGLKPWFIRASVILTNCPKHTGVFVTSCKRVRMCAVLGNTPAPRKNTRLNASIWILTNTYFKLLWKYLYYSMNNLFPIIFVDYRKLLLAKTLSTH